jgi:hypothetical protein
VKGTGEFSMKRDTDPEWRALEFKIISWDERIRSRERDLQLLDDRLRELERGLGVLRRRLALGTGAIPLPQPHGEAYEASEASHASDASDASEALSPSTTA